VRCIAENAPSRSKDTKYFIFASLMAKKSSSEARTGRDKRVPEIRRRMDEPSSTHGRASVDALTSLRRRIEETPSLQRVRARTRGSMAIRPNGDKKRTAPSLHGIERSGVWLQIRIYSAAVSAGASAAASVVSSATGASAAGASAAVAFLERRVRFAFFCVLAMFSSKSTSSMKQVGALSP